ncbi:MAG: hypothetical protein IT374_15435 [Polyangiaceae bacterium]|nr:hypothetical protein [Polyangiaceae bacterium]
MTLHHARLASLLAVVTPMLACGGSTTDDTNPGAAAGAGGGSAGSASAGKAGSTAAGAGGAAAGSAGSTAGSAGKATAGSAGATAGSGGSTAGSAGKATGGSAGATAGSGGSTAGSAGKATAGSGGSSAGSGGSTAGSGGSTAGSGGTAAGSGGSTAGSAGAFPYACIDPKPVLVGGADSGYDTCANGTTRRREKLTCPTTVPRADACVSSNPGADTCSHDSECTAQPNGHCSASNGFGPGGCTCQYGCLDDSECGVGGICVCADPVGVCRSSTCTDSTSCGFGDCTSYDASKGCGFLEFACQTPTDTCGGDSDCANSGPGGWCGFANDPSTGMPASTRSCVPGSCAIGRPLFVDEGVRTAELARRRDWAA